MEKEIFWISDKPQTPPVGSAARVEAGTLLRRVQQGESLGLPESRPMPMLGRRVHELRINDSETRLTWRIIYRIDSDLILVVHWWAKKTQHTNQRDIDLCEERLARYDRALAEAKREERRKKRQKR